MSGAEITSLGATLQKTDIFFFLISSKGTVDLARIIFGWIPAEFNVLTAY